MFDKPDDRYVYDGYDPLAILLGLQNEPNINADLTAARNEDVEARSRVASVARRLFRMSEEVSDDQAVNEIEEFLLWIHKIKEGSRDFARRVAVAGTPPGMTYLEWFCLVLHESTIRWLRIDDQIQGLRIASGHLPPLEYYQAIYGEREGGNKYGESKLLHMMR